MSPKGYERTGPGQQGLMVLDMDGRLVGFYPRVGSDISPFDFQVQTYRGEQVITWWEGTVTAGHGHGIGRIFDASYHQIARIQAGNGLQADLHELNLTPQGTALITAYHTVTVDLSKLGGPAAGEVLACQAQEIDVATGKLLFSWDSLDHVPVTDTYQKLPPGGQKAPFDYFHINSVSLAADGDLLISARNTWAIYKVARNSGRVVWRLGGKQSDFDLGRGVEFYWQHHVRSHPGSVLSIFDDGASPSEEKRSRGLLIRVDETTNKATLLREYVHPARLLAANQGSMQVLDDGQVFVGWGDQPYFSQFLTDGTLILDGRFPADEQSYRAFNFPWSGRPSEDPALVVKADTTGGVTLYVSWNGATEVASWQVLTGTNPSAMAAVATAAHTAFETTISVNSKRPYFAVAALDRHDAPIGRSKVVRYP